MFWFLTRVTAVVAAGLAVRHFVPGPVGEVGGVVLYAVLIYCLVAFLRPTTPPSLIGLLTVTICWAVELFQLTPYPAAAVSVPLAHLVLGAGFQWSDLACYPIGALLAAAGHVAGHAPEPLGPGVDRAASAHPRRR